MGITKEKLYDVIEALSEDERQKAFEFICFLKYRAERRLSWEDIDLLPAESEKLSEEEKNQLEQPEHYIALEKANKEYGL
jgi:hypothetical protein